MESKLIYVKNKNILDFVVLLEEHRINAGLTQTQLADMCGVSKNTISSIECGQHLPSLSLTIKLCIALDCKFHDLVEIWDCEELDFIKL